jgi:S-DNA-T family DNA segregation ATPase FtsK/SpoIIIE
MSKIIGKDEEIAGAVGKESVLIKRDLSYIAISVPKNPRPIINFQNCLHQFMLAIKNQNMALPFMLGMSSDGELTFADLARQPHILIGGATNSGKSIFVSQVICSLALTNKPSDLHISVVDTKRLDLTLFSELQHIREVITEVNDLRVYLEDTLRMIRKRLEEMSGIARNIKEWNEIGIDPMPYHVIIIDELADVMDQDAALLAAFPRGQKPVSIGTLLKQIAQISRAAGVHLIAATQRPSVDAIKGDTKTNFPSRIAFKLPTMMDSRVILDENGAERLLGMGDMLCKIDGSDSPKRFHSAFVTMRDILQITGQNQAIREMYAIMEERKELQ